MGSECLSLDIDMKVSKKIIELYAKFLFASIRNARVDVQQRFYEAFNKEHLRLKYRNPQVDFESQDGFWKPLENASRVWWDKRAMKGPGVDW